MDASSSTLASTGLPSARRADAGSVRLGGRDVAGLMLVGDMYGAPYDLLAGFLTCSPASWTCSRPGCAGSWRAGAALGTPILGGLALGRRGAG
jgi:hypothetical protein